MVRAPDQKIFFLKHSKHKIFCFRYQPSVRLPYVEAKIAASELLIAVLEKISTRNSIDHNLNAVLNELQGLRQTLNQINDTLMRKLGCPIPVTPIDDQVKRNSHRQSTNRTSQVKKRK